MKLLRCASQDIIRFQPCTGSCTASATATAAAAATTTTTTTTTTPTTTTTATTTTTSRPAVVRPVIAQGDVIPGSRLATPAKATKAIKVTGVGRGRESRSTVGISPENAVEEVESVDGISSKPTSTFTSVAPSNSTTATTTSTTTSNSTGTGTGLSGPSHVASSAGPTASRSTGLESDRLEFLKRICSKVIRSNGVNVVNENISLSASTSTSTSTSTSASSPSSKHSSEVSVTSAINSSIKSTTSFPTSSTKSLVSASSDSVSSSNAALEPSTHSTHGPVSHSYTNDYERLYDILDTLNQCLWLREAIVISSRGTTGEREVAEGRPVAGAAAGAAAVATAGANAGVPSRSSTRINTQRSAR